MSFKNPQGKADKPSTLQPPTAAPSVVKAIVVVPCFNEEHRLDADQLLMLCREGTQVLFVNDGSVDGTQARLEAIVATHPDEACVLRLEHNVGKGEAVRRGLLHAIRSGAARVGYFDADLATPPEEMTRLLGMVSASGAKFAMGSRVALLGRDIQRSNLRHYLGRIFASVASVGLSMRVYDTQCGAKAMWVDEVLMESLATPFQSRWVFDVELIMRVRQPGRWAASDFVEMPLSRWSEVGGSKLTARSMARAAGDLMRLTAPTIARGLSRRS